MLAVFLERERRVDEFFLRRLEETDGCLVSTSSILSLEEDLQRILWVVLRRTIRFWCGPVPSVVSKSVEYDVPGRLVADTNVESEVEAEAETDADAGVDGDERLFDESLLPGSDTLRTSFPFFLNMSRICVNWVSFGSILSGACKDLGNLFASD